jgi:hypothetical protein
MAQHLSPDPQIITLNIPAGTHEHPRWALGQLLIGSGVALTVAWSGFLVWMAARGLLWLIS